MNDFFQKDYNQFKEEYVEDDDYKQLKENVDGSSEDCERQLANLHLECKITKHPDTSGLVCILQHCERFFLEIWKKFFFQNTLLHHHIF